MGGRCGRCGRPRLPDQGLVDESGRLSANRAESNLLISPAPDAGPSPMLPTNRSRALSVQCVDTQKSVLGVVIVLAMLTVGIVLRSSHAGSAAGGRCLGTIQMEGHGPVQIVKALTDTPNNPSGSADVVDAGVKCYMKGRTYFGDSCSPEATSGAEYVALQLLGKTLRYTVNLAGAKCGCNAAFYLTSMHQNSDKSDCSDYYCDANKVCGVRCAEIDIQEANSLAWYSTLHDSDDGDGKGEGYGAIHREWTPEQYGIGGQCIDTSMPFQVAASFPVDATGALQSVDVKLTQPGKTCLLSVSVGNYQVNGRDGMTELTQALAAGMTPIISYWGKDVNGMLWFDGKGDDRQGPCAVEDPTTCADSVTFSGFSVEEGAR